MDRKYTFLCIIPARGGSKGIPNKNIVDVNGHPLISYSIRTAIDSCVFDRIIVSTDSSEIAKVAKKYGAEIPYCRPEQLSTDDSKVEDTIYHALDWVGKHDKEYDYVCFLQPTSPLLEPEDVINVKEMLFEKSADMIVSVGESPINISWAREIPEDLSMKDFDEDVCGTNKQGFENTYFLNGAIYLGKWDIFYDKKNYYKQNTYAYKMPYEKSIDIDYPVDLKIVEYFIKNRV